MFYFVIDDKGLFIWWGCKKQTKTIRHTQTKNNRTVCPLDSWKTQKIPENLKNPEYLKKPENLNNPENPRT